MKKILYRAFLPLLLSVLLIAGACWFYADQLLDNFVRPRIEQFATKQFGAEVRIGRLGWTDTGLDIFDLSVVDPQRFIVAVPCIELHFNATALWRWKLDALHVTRPQVEIIPSQTQRPTSALVLEFPERLPLDIARLTVTNGRLFSSTEEHRWQLRDLEFSGALQRQSDFSLTALFGPDQEHPLEATGTVQFSPQPNLSLTTFSWQGHQLLTAPLQIGLAGPVLIPGGSTIRLGAFDHLMLERIFIALGRPSPVPEGLVFSLTDAALRFSLEERAFQLELTAEKGLLGWNELTGQFKELKLLGKRDENDWSFSGQLEGPAETSLELSARLEENGKLAGKAVLDAPDPGRLKAELFGLPVMPLAGGLQLAATYRFEKEHFTLDTEIHGHPEQSDRNDLFDVGSLVGKGRLLLADGQEQFSLDLQLASQPLLSFSGTFRQIDFSLQPVTLQEIKKLLPAELVPPTIRAARGLGAAGRFTRDAGDWTGKISMTAEQVLLPELVLSELAGTTTMHFTPGRINFEKTTIGFSLAHGDGLSARVDARGNVSLEQENISLTLQQLSLTQLNYISPDGLSGLGEATFEVSGTVSGPRSKGPLLLDLNGTITAREVLRGAFYADLSSYRAEFSMTGELAPEMRTLTARAFKINLPQIGSLAAAGRFSPEQVSTQGHIELTDLATSYGEHLGPLLSDVKPTLAGLTLAGGMALDYHLIWAHNGWQTKGSLLLRGLDASWERLRLEIVDGRGSIPFAASSGQVPVSAEIALDSSGEIFFGMLSAGLATLEQGSLQLSASNNRFSILSPLLLQLAGGGVAMEALNLDWGADDLQGSVKVNIAAVELQELTEELGMPVMKGNFSADLGTIHYAERQLSTEGVASIEVFGGRFKVGNMRYRNPFSSYPTFYADIDFSGLNLKQATRTFAFGEMNGVVDGHIHGLQLFGSTPAAFTAAVNTRNKGKRNISVKALKNLSILSQGGIGSVLSQGLYRFIDFYRYRAIGFKCALENDIFTLEGTAFPGSDRYLVYGGLLPPRIDITTSTPTVSFKEMVKRISRVDRAAN